MSSNQLTDARRIEVINEATQAWGRKDNDLLYLEVCKAIEREVAASPVEPPEAAPIDEVTCARMGHGVVSIADCFSPELQEPGVIFMELPEQRDIGLDTGDVFPEGSRAPSDKTLAYISFANPEAIDQTISVLQRIKAKHFPAPSPADERATFDNEVGKVIADAATRGIAWMAFKAGAAYARAASANETDDQRTAFEFLRELVADDYWSESKANRAREILARAASANETEVEGATQASEEFRHIALTELYEFQELTGCSTSDEYRAKLAAMATEAQKPFGWAQPKGGNYFTRNESSAKRIGGLVPVYTTPQPPAQAEVRVGLTDEQIDDFARPFWRLPNPGDYFDYHGFARALLESQKK